MTMRFLPFAMVLPLGLTACTVGPNYAGPPKSSAALANPAFARGDDAVTSGPALARWWEPLNDPQLSALIDAALAHNPSIDEAQARIREASAILRQRQAAGLPTVAPSFMAAHLDIPPISGSGDRTSFTFYNLGATASWEPDLWGADRRNNEAARATIGQRQASLADTQVSLSAQVAQAYVNLRDAQTRKALLVALAERQSHALDLTKQRQAAGTATQQDVERAQADLQSTLAQGAPLQAQAEVAMNQLAVLTGQAPGALDAQLGAAQPIPTLPAQVAIGDPARLIAQRPDVRVAERALAASTAQIGVNKAKLLPNISFTGILGLGGSKLGDLVDPSMGAWGLLPQLKWSGLDWGKAHAVLRQSEAQRDTAEAQYRSAVLKALEDAESSLSRFGAARQRLAHLAQGEAAAQRDEALGAQRVAAGTASGLEQIGRENARLQAGLSLAQANADLTLDFIAVNKALGLGWHD
ncbi:efflux transporter outer membrane subunit [Novosphingobium rosa]|uniref:efflux transporter outer membrane subunit n=1 Tax=Novosphingobium rosa TaxID=76978 RepID=UPI000A80D8C6|nr:efflux transporter outer membrane subunit [Novosphingobium rosa]